jgi:anti-anti-sigma factor
MANDDSTETSSDAQRRAGAGGAELEAELEALRRENKELRARVVALEGALLDVRAGDAHVDRAANEGPSEGVDSVTTERALRSRKRLMHAVIDNLPSVIFVKDAEGRYILVNRQTEVRYEVVRSKLLGSKDEDYFAPDVCKAMRERDLEALRSGGPIEFDERIMFRDDFRDYHTIKLPIFDEEGGLMGICGIATDITDRKREEQERLALREQVIAAQDEALREVSTPLVPIAAGVVAMPLVGSIDNARADRIVGTLLDGIIQNQAHSVILDITGVRTVDSHVAGALVAAAKSVRLLGARVVVTGIRPEVARTLVDLGMDLEGIVTRGNFQSGIAFAMKR